MKDESTPPEQKEAGSEEDSYGKIVDIISRYKSLNKGEVYDLAFDISELLHIRIKI